MDNAMVLRGFAQRTREAYLHCVRDLAKYYWVSPERLAPSQLQIYLLYLIREISTSCLRAWLSHYLIGKVGAGGTVLF